MASHDTASETGEGHVRPVIRYEDWKAPIQTATDLDQLVAIVHAYLAQWTPSMLAPLPTEVSTAPLHGSEDIPVRAVVAAQAELKLPPENPGSAPLREMAFTMMAAATRLRFLTAMRARERSA